MKLRRLLLPPMFNPEDEIWIQIPDDCELLVGDRATEALKDIRILTEVSEGTDTLFTRSWNRAKEAPHAPLVDLVVARPEDHGE